MSWPTPSHASEYTYCILSLVDQTSHMPARTNLHLNMCISNPSHASEETNWISTCFEQISPMPAKADNAIPYVLSKHLPCQQGHIIYLKMCWPSPSHASKDTGCISICFVQTAPMHAGMQNVSQHEFTKPPPCQRGLKMHFNKCCPNPSHASQNTKWISTNLLCQQGRKMHLYMCWPNPHLAS